MDYDRLRDLQAKFDENPRRYFAPLANEYRKAGNPKRAIEICRAHLAQMPGHMSGQVVYGQALFEGAEYDEARKIFEGAIVLDPENLIALRALGDLALQAGDTQSARSWYKRLLEADPKDAAAIQLVAEIDAGRGGDAPSDSSFTVDFSFVDQPPAGAAPSAPESDTATPVAQSSAPDSAASDIEPLGVDGLSSSAPEPESPLRNIGTSAAADAPDSALLGLERHYPAAEAAPSTPEPAEIKPEVEPIGPERDALDNWSPPASAAVNEEAAPSADAGPESGASSFAGSTNPEPFVNETMAQLYLQQGYRQLALRVYRQLSEAKPDDQALKDRISEIVATQTAEDRGAPRGRREEPSIETPMSDPDTPRSPSIESPLPHGPGSEPGSVESPSFDRQPVDSPPPSTPSREPDSVESPVREEPRAEPEGIAARQPSIREFFATLGRRRPAPPSSATTWGRSDAGNGPVPAAGAAGDSAPSASLDAVFAGASVSAKDARAASALAGAFSASARVSSPPPQSSPPTPRGNPRLQAQESEEDVAKFRAWLDGLTGE